MKTKRKRSIGDTTAPASAPNIIVKSGGGVAGPAVIGVGLFAAYFFVIKPMISAHAENKAEGDTTPEGQVANQFKAVFGPKDSPNWVVNDADYKQAALLLTNGNKKLVFEKYRALTDRNLSDDISKHINPANQAAAAKIQQYNSKPGKLFSITPDNKVKFEVGKGDTIRFVPGQTSPIRVYAQPMGIALNDVKDAKAYAMLLSKLKADPKTVSLTVSVQVKPNAKVYPVVETKEILWSGIQESTSFFKIFYPFVNTKRSYAAIKIQTGNDPKTYKPVYAWIDARDMIVFNKKSIGSTLQNLM